MRSKAILLGVIISLPLLFVLINWGVFGAHETFFFLLGSVNLSIGIVLLSLVVFAVLGVLLCVGLWRTQLLLAYRRQSQELETQRTLADNAEASRFTELTALLRSELAKQDVHFDAALAALGTEMRESTNSLAAVLGELDDRLRGSGAVRP